MNVLLRSTLVLALAGFASCTKCDDEVVIPEQPGGGWCGTPTPGQPCSPDVICTMEFASVGGTVVRANNSPVALDSFVVTDLAGTPLPPVNGQTVYGFGESTGRFTVVSDAWLSGHQNTFMDVRAIGWAGGTLLFDQQYSVGADCCHVRKASGPDVITVN